MATGDRCLGFGFYVYESMDVCVPHACSGPQGPEKDIGSPGNGVTGCCEQPCGFWAPNLGPLEEQQPVLSHLSSLGYVKTV